jgi:hypothetical protein
MPRKFFRSLGVRVHAVRDRWYARPFALWLADSRLWSLQRRGITAAVGAGLAICFVPLPIHVPLALTVAILMRINVPAIIGTVFLVNPLTFAPTYYFAYLVGSWLTGSAPQRFAFEMSWDWLQYGLGPLWKPFLVGCAACAICFGIAGRVALESIWRWKVRKRYRLRRGGASA